LSSVLTWTPAGHYKQYINGDVVLDQVPNFKKMIEEFENAKAKLFEVYSMAEAKGQQLDVQVVFRNSTSSSGSNRVTQIYNHNQEKRGLQYEIVMPISDSDPKFEWIMSLSDLSYEVRQCLASACYDKAP